MKVVIDGIEYVPVAEASPNAEQIARGIMDSFWGSSIPDYTTWQEEAKSLYVECTDLPSAGCDTQVIDVVSAILKRISAA